MTGKKQPITTISGSYWSNGEPVSTPEGEEIIEKNLAKSESGGTIKDKVSERLNPPQRRVDRVPNIRGMPMVTVYAYQIGFKGYRYSITPPLHTTSAWEKKMSGGEAHNFLTTVKNKNRGNRLESLSLPE